MMMNNNLDRLEAQLRALFEERLIKLLTGKSTSDDFINELIQVMRAGLEKDTEGALLAPDRYILEVSPESLADWLIYQPFLDEMSVQLSEQGAQEGFIFRTSPTIQIVENRDVLRDEWQIRAEFSSESEAFTDTAAMDSPELTPEQDLIPINAFLVVGGKTNFPLRTVVVNIGRHSDNDLVLEDQYVSRHHAQLRAINRRYVIFDVGSTGGVLLNGKPVTQATLHPGDVIRIGMTHLIYVQDTTGDLPTSALSLDTEMED
jgi:hypothetical protein